MPDTGNSVSEKNSSRKLGEQAELEGQRVRRDDLAIDSVAD
jgi:hypothetical protein